MSMRATIKIQEMCEDIITQHFPRIYLQHMYVYIYTLQAVKIIYKHSHPYKYKHADKPYLIIIILNFVILYNIS